MRRVIFFFIFLLVWAQAAGAQSIITVEVHDNGNALWIMEKQLPLNNQTDIDDWEEFIKTGQTGNQQEIADFSKRMEWFLLSAQKFSNRSMSAEKFNLSYNTAKTPSGAYGLIQYSFEWNNFARSESGKIIIGDAFSEGMLLSQDNVLVIKIPDGYDVEKASPGFDKRDGNRLIWDGTLYRNFARGEPTVVFVSSGINPLFLIVILIILAAGAFFMFTKRRSKPGTQSDPVSLENIAIEDLKYEEKIERFLLRSGGQASQSDIIKEIGLSKSRVSTILSQMKEKGQIIKIKNGSGNLIRIAKK
ncbi:MAG: winged helix-turn-helix transcriptional regulator [Candidatus Methanoperedens sp.]|nr:winged helix-turn-helix transcriptional regulator [Candidatus Methanoperedens sp.]